jgi:hypothetical protein
MPAARGTDADATAATADADVEARAAASRSLWRLLLAVIGVATALWVVLLLAWDEAPFTLTFDDAYYYLGIARNLVDGHGSTFDQINLTNGYHPLWLGISTLPFLVGLDDLAAARALLVLQLVLGWGLTLVLVTRIVTDQVDGWSLGRKAAAGDPDVARGLRRGASVVVAAVVALVAVNPFLVKVVANGLESGIVVPLYAALLLIGSRRRGRWLTGSHASRWATAVLLSLAFLARTDAILLIGCLGLWCLAELVTARRAPRPTAPDGVEIRGTAPRLDPPGLGALVEVFALPAIVIAGYLLVNQQLFGTPLQVSGLIKQRERTGVVIVAFLIVAAIALAIGRHGFRRLHGTRARRAARFPHTGAFALRTSWFGAFCVLVLGYYTVLQSQQWLWYYGPVLLYLVILFVLAVADITEASLRDRAAGAGPARTVGPVAAIFVVPLLLALVYTGRSFTDPTLRSIQIANRDAGVWIDEHLPDDAVLASWDAGAVGYFSHRRVVNIDGVVNSLEFHDARLAGRMAEFLRCRSVGFVTNHGPDGGDPVIVELIDDIGGDDAGARATAVYAVPFAFSGTTTGSAGTNSSGERTMGMYVYEIPADAVGPRPDDVC